jgi:FtsZ-binding cell division protein ZapB
MTAELDSISTILKAEVQTAAASSAKKARDDVARLVDELRQELAMAQAELRKTQREVEELRVKASSNSTARDQAAEMAALRKQMAEVRKDMDLVRKVVSDRKDASSSAFPSRELEILTSNIAKIGNRASQVETLQMELDILKGRVERVEGSVQDAESESRSLHRPSPAFQAADEGPRMERVVGKKRSMPTTGERADRQDAAPSKRLALSSETDASSLIAQEAINVAADTDGVIEILGKRRSGRTAMAGKSSQRRTARKSVLF